jgi:hypothetical protein
MALTESGRLARRLHCLQPSALKRTPLTLALRTDPMITPQQIQKDVMKLVEGGVASSVITAQAVVAILAVWIYW